MPCTRWVSLAVTWWLAVAAAKKPYPWPTVRGRTAPGLYSVSPHRAPKDWESRLAWTFPGARGKHSTIFLGGVVIDDERNVYTSSIDAVYKLDEFGNIVWLFPVGTSTTPVLHDGTLYTSTKDGKIIALSMKTGGVIFEKKVSDLIGSDISGAGVSDGVVISCTHGFAAGGASRVTALNASDGSLAWEFRPDGQLWNFMPMFTDEGSFVFQDQLGGVYHLRTTTGKLLWKNGYKGSWDETWTDGVPMLGPNRMVYAVHAGCHVSTCGPVVPGSIDAYSLDTGEKVWSQVTPYSPNSQPLVAKLGKSSRYSVVLPIGQPGKLPPSIQILYWPLPMFARYFLFHLATWLGESQKILWGNVPYPSVVQAYDAETGAKQWSWQAPDLVTGVPAGDEELLIKRTSAGNLNQPICIPNLWASPTMDADGRIFLGHANGRIYSIHDANEDGMIDPEQEVKEMNTKVAFGHPGLGMAPGMAVMVNCDVVLAFKY